jgi:hypothetical protein
MVPTPVPTSASSSRPMMVHTPSAEPRTFLEAKRQYEYHPSQRGLFTQLEKANVEAMEGSGTIFGAQVPK